jgi:hypothetical protein
LLAELPEDRPAAEDRLVPLPAPESGRPPLRWLAPAGSPARPPSLRAGPPFVESDRDR